MKICEIGSKEGKAQEEWIPEFRVRKRESIKTEVQ